jgi:trk system potassium uptake protein
VIARDAVRHAGLFRDFLDGFSWGLWLAVIEMETIDLVTAFTTIASAINNIGPGLSQVGAVENYGFPRAPSKVLLSLVMLAGRLEFYSVLVLLAPGFWRSK